MFPFEYWLIIIFTAKASGLVCAFPVIRYRLGCADIASIFLWTPVMIFVHFLMWAIVGIMISLAWIWVSRVFKAS
jgi:hypothetical protein